MTDTHICQELHSYNVSNSERLKFEIIKGEDTWWFSSVPLKMTIKFCPFCGVELR